MANEEQSNNGQSDNGGVVELEVTKHHVGVVGVDSGQAMICDPSYIGGQWQGNELSAEFMARHVRDTETGNVYAYPEDFASYEWRFNEDLEVFSDGPDPEPRPGRTGVMENVDEILPTVNKLIESGRFEHVTNDSKEPLGEFSYQGCCAATGGSESYGQLNYTMGHAGAGVAFSTGVGDGVYPVYAYKANVPGWGERVIKIEICFFEEEDLNG
jgi:hypothetical protein